MIVVRNQTTKMPLRYLTNSERVKLIEDNENLDLNQLGLKYHVSERTVRRTLGNKDNILHQVAEGRQNFKTNKNVTQEHDRKVLERINQAQIKGIPISVKIILRFAKEESDEKREYTTGWWQRFKLRCNISRAKLSGESCGIDKGQVEMYKLTIPSLIENFYDEFIYNLDETAIFYKQTPTSTFIIKSQSHFGTTISKQRLSLLFCVNKKGERLPVLIIGHSHKPRCLNNTERLNKLNVIYTANENAWMTKKIFTEYLDRWHSELAKKNMKIILFLDNFSGHKVEFEKYPLIRFEFFPSNTTSALQPLDAGVNKVFKNHYNNQHLDYIFNQLEHKTSLKEISKKISVLDAFEWIDAAWSKITDITIKNCWKHCGFSVTENSFEDDDENDDSVVYQD